MANEVTKVGAGDTIFLVVGILPMGRYEPLEGAAFTTQERANALITDMARDEPERYALQWPLGFKVVGIAIDW